MINKHILKQIEALETAKAEAQRFLKTVDPAIKELGIYGPLKRIHHAAAKRSSMDLSRALTAIRRTPG